MSVRGPTYLGVFTDRYAQVDLVDRLLLPALRVLARCVGLCAPRRDGILSSWSIRAL